MHYYLYEIKNNIDGKIYVGVHRTKNLDDGYMGSGKIIARAIAKYGVDNFTKTILETFDSSETMFAREKEVVNDEFLGREDVYNLRRGGNGGFDYINSSEEIKQNKSIKNRGKDNPFFGKTHTKEVKERLAELASKQWKGTTKSENHRQKIAEANTGVPFTEERKRKISDAKKGKPAPNKGKPAPKLTCPYCNLTGGGISNMTRWHFDNCKSKKDILCT